MWQPAFAPENSEESWRTFNSNFQADGKEEIALFPYLQDLVKEKAELEAILTFNYLRFLLLTALSAPAHCCRLEEMLMGVKTGH